MRRVGLSARCARKPDHAARAHGDAADFGRQMKPCRPRRSRATPKQQHGLEDHRSRDRDRGARGAEQRDQHDAERDVARERRPIDHRAARCSPTMLSRRSTGPTVARASGPIARMNMRK
jgi:hypothetical protein